MHVLHDLKRTGQRQLRQPHSRQRAERQHAAPNRHLHRWQRVASGACNCEVWTCEVSVLWRQRASRPAAVCRCAQQGKFHRQATTDEAGPTTPTQQPPTSAVVRQPHLERPRHVVRNDCGSRGGASRHKYIVVRWAQEQAALPLLPPLQGLQPPQCELSTRKAATAGCLVVLAPGPAA